jgi:hypothetical protein
MVLGDWKRAVAVLIAVFSLGFGRSTTAFAEVFTAGPSDDVESMINGLGPGDELVLSGGTYTLNERFSFSIAGTEGSPIVIRAAEGETPHFHRPNADQNIIDIDDAEYVTMRGIEFSGGSAGIRISGARYLTIEACEVHDTGDVAVRANDSGVTYDSLRILRNHIHHTNNTGEGMYLGCNNGGCEVVNSLIEGNYVHHTNQPSVNQGDGIELKEGSFGNVIRDNVIHDTNYPCILTYASNGPQNVIERNVMWNCGDHAIQSAADAVIRNNVILSANADGIAMQPHQSGSPSNLEVVHNTVLQANGAAISLRSISGPVIVANNALYAQSGDAFFVNGGTSGLVFEGNVGTGGVSNELGFGAGDFSTDFVSASFEGAPPMDVFPAVGSALQGAGSATYVPADDFNGTPRNGAADAGAYTFSAGGNPGWTLAPEFKASTPGPNPGSGGSGGSTGAGGSGGSSGPPRTSPGGGSSGCNAAGMPSSTPLWASAWLVGLLALRRRA